MSDEPQRCRPLVPKLVLLILAVFGGGYSLTHLSCTMDDKRFSIRFAQPGFQFAQDRPMKHVAKLGHYFYGCLTG